MTECVFANATVVTPEAAFRGAVRVRDGVIADLSEGRSVPPGALDLEGDLLLPGLVELHTDNVEKHMVPRPGVFWPSPLAALLAHDVQMAGAGITTVYDAISVGEYMDRDYRRQLFLSMIEGVCEAARHDVFRAEHRLHLRCEISDDAMVGMFEPWAAHPLLGLVSIMDHTPGQRQWRDLSKLRQFRSDLNQSEAEFAAYVQERLARSSTSGVANRQAVLDLWRPRGLPTASHDDTTVEHVEEALADGILISEFPTTLEAARAARAGGMINVMGAPNLVRGGSHSGNASAVELADEGLLDAFSSDYAPWSMLHAAMLLHERHGWELPAAVATVSLNPARVLGLDDRGAIAEGRRADLVRVAHSDDAPVVRAVWRLGERVA